MKITIFRHNKTAENIRKSYLGKTDISICDYSAQEIFPNVEKVYVSGLRRTAQTANIIFPNAKTIASTCFNEMDFGEFECKTYQELSGNANYQAWLNSNCKKSFGGVENFDAFVKKCSCAFQEIITQNLNTCDHLYFVLHGGTIMAICHDLSEPHTDYFNWHIKCGAKLEFTYKDSKLHLI